MKKANSIKVKKEQTPSKESNKVKRNSLYFFHCKMESLKKERSYLL